MERYTFFWSGPFSQWAMSPFTVFGEKYNCAEQYMMAEKARFFKDWSTADKIMMAYEPNVQKSLGRMVKPFDEVAWSFVARRIVYTGSYFKYTQNPRFMRALLETAGTTLVEASPYDKVWGIGLCEDDPLALDRATWQGSNWLGEVLTVLREDIIRNANTFANYQMETHS